MRGELIMPLLAEIEEAVHELYGTPAAQLLARAAAAIATLRNPPVREVPLKAWTRDEAQRCNVTPHSIDVRRLRGKYPQLRLRRVNRRVVFVQIPDAPWTP